MSDIDNQHDESVVDQAEEEFVEVELDADPAEQVEAEAKKPEKAEKPAKADDDDDDADDDDDDDDDDVERLSADQREDDEGSASEADIKARQARRARRMRAKLAASEAFAQMRAENIALRRAQIETQARLLAIEAQNVEREIADATARYQRAERIAAEAMSKGDGVNFQRAERAKQEAAARYQELNGLKSRLGGNYQQLQSAWQAAGSDVDHAMAQQQQGGPQQVQPRPKEPSAEHKRYAETFVADHPWIKDGGRDAAAVRAIDIALEAEGFDPSSREYWNELRDRVRLALPKRFKQAPSKSASPPVGSNRGSATTSKTTVRIPAAMVQACKDAGYYDDPVQRNDYFKRALAAQKQHQASR